MGRGRKRKDGKLGPRLGKRKRRWVVMMEGVRARGLRTGGVEVAKERASDEDGGAVVEGAQVNTEREHVMDIEEEEEEEERVPKGQIVSKEGALMPEHGGERANRVFSTNIRNPGRRGRLRMAERRQQR